MTADTSPTTPNSNPAEPRRRLWQFRLRTVLAVSVVFALALGWQVNRAARQQRAVAAIRALGGYVYYEQNIDGGAEEFGVGNRRIGRWIGERFGRDLVDRVTWVDLDGVDVSDDDLVHVEALRSLKLLRIDGGQITADGLVRLASLGRLEVLGLQNHRHVADGLIHLRRLGRLRSLVLSNTDTADQHIEPLGQIESLENIDLVNTNITNAALSRLADLPNLKNLLVGGTRVTEAGVSSFRKTRPEVRVEF